MIESTTSRSTDRLDVAPNSRSPRWTGIRAIAAAAAAGAVRAEQGERPGVALGAAVTMVVMIESIGPDGRTATFITSDGGLQAIYVQREESRAFASSLQAGDLVQLTRAESLALVVEPMGE